jgi:hypothetical protein
MIKFTFLGNLVQILQKIESYFNLVETNHDSFLIDLWRRNSKTIKKINFNANRISKIL